MLHDDRGTGWRKRVSNRTGSRNNASGLHRQAVDHAIDHVLNNRAPPSVSDEPARHSGV